MAKKSRTWTCQRQTNGRICRAKNPAKFRKCQTCGKRRPAKKYPEHMAVLRVTSYESLVERHGEQCGICGKSRSPKRRLQRDHDHGTSVVRGLLCFRCNTMLPKEATIEWLELAIDYLRRAESDQGQP